MAVITDTHKFHTALVKAGFEKEKADVLVDALTSIDNEVATKSDIALLKKDIENLKSELTVRIWAAMATAVGILAAINLGLCGILCPGVVILR